MNANPNAEQIRQHPLPNGSSAKCPAHEAALQLADEWNLPVFPCRPNDEALNGKTYKAKSPHTARGFEDASRNLEQINQWWSRWPDALIGVPTGRASKLLVVDVDPQGAEWYAQNDGRLACGRIHKTRRGHHLLYRMPEADIRNSAGKLAAGVDVRAEGGYVIWWAAAGLETVGGFEDICEPPAWLVKALTEPERRSEAVKADSRAIAEGGRNQALTREAGRLRRLGHSPDVLLAALREINRERCSPPLDDAEIETIARSVARYEPGGFDGFVGEGEGISGAWPEPKPLENALPKVAEFTPHLLPDVLRPWVVDVAERTQAPIEYVGISAMVSLGAALGRKVGVRPRRRDDWMEFGNLWGAVIGPPSWMKSPALDEGKRPLCIIEARMLEGHELLHREWEADHEAAKAKRDGAKDRARQAARKCQSFDKMELVAAAVPDEPMPGRLIVNDATVPALCDVLRANPNGVLVFRDELAGLIAELDREGMEGSRGFYITGWSGKEGYTQDRILRGTNLRVPHVCLSLLGGIQPARVAPLLRESIVTGGGDGFLARFSMAVWPDSPGEYKAMDRQPNADARERAYAVYRMLHELDHVRIGAEIMDGEAPFLRLEPAAAERFTEWDVELRNRLRAGTEDGALAAHLGKYPKAISGLALLTHLADGGTGDISESAVVRALGWAELLESHARRIYASLGQSHINAARSLLTRLRRGDLSAPFTIRDVYRRGWAYLTDPEAARAAADVLEANHYIRAIATPPTHAGGRPSVSYHLNPAARS